MKLLTDVGGEVLHGEAKLAALCCGAAGVTFVFGDLSLVVELAEGEVDGLVVAVAEDAKLDLRARGEAGDSHLERATVGDLLTVELLDDVAVLEAGAAGR